MFSAIGQFLSMIWNGLKTLPFFDTGFSFAQLMLFLTVFSLIVPVLGVLFGGSGED